jgi:hypothetical protein
MSSDSYSARGNLYVVSDPVEQGTRGSRFDLPADSSRTSACEVLRKRTAAPGTDDYYALALRFPTNWVEPSTTFWGMLIAQFNYTAMIGPPVGLYAHGNHVNVVMQSGYVQNNAATYSTGNDVAGTISVPGGTQAIPSPMALGVWHELIVHVHWSTESSGVVEVWHRLAGDSTWQKTVTITGYPTLQWDATHPASSLSTLTTSDKIGAYRGASTVPLSLWHDGFCVATGFAAAAGCL